MTFKEYATYDALGLAALIRDRAVSTAEVLEAAIDVIERRDGVLNAVVYKGYDDARKAGAEPLDGPFAGVPLLLKDLALEVKGWPRTSGSRFAAVDTDTYDNVLTTRYREAGMVLLGKSNTPEFGITGTTESARLGPCRNPWQPDHIAGGSSGGAASAVASGMVPVAHASDGLGSIRIPAACCGLVGLKPTRDRNPNGWYDYDRASGMVVDHVVSRTVRDSAAMLDATGYPESDAPYAPAPKERPYMEEIEREPGRLRIAFSSKRPGSDAPIDPEVSAAIERTATLLEDLGHDVEDRAPDFDYTAFWAANSGYAGANFAASFARWIELKGREPEPGELEPLTWALVNGGRRGTPVDVMRGWQDQRMLARRLLGFFNTVDVYLTPVMSTPAPKIGVLDPVAHAPEVLSARAGAIMPYCWPSNFTGQPSLSLPLWQSTQGLPIATLLTGRYGDEATLFRLAAQLERALPWAARRPEHYG